MDDLWEMEEGISADLHLGTVIQEARDFLSRGALQAITMEQVQRICHEELQVPMEVMVGEEDIAPRVMVVASAYLRRRFPEAPIDTCLAVGQAIGEMAGGDTAYGPPNDAKSRKAYEKAYDVLSLHSGSASTPKATLAVISAILDRCF